MKIRNVNFEPPYWDEGNMKMYLWYKRGWWKRILRKRHLRKEKEQLLKDQDDAIKGTDYDFTHNWPQK